MTTMILTFTLHRMIIIYFAKQLFLQMIHAETFFQNASAAFLELVVHPAALAIPSPVSANACRTSLGWNAARASRITGSWPADRVVSLAAVTGLVPFLLSVTRLAERCLKSHACNQVVVLQFENNYHHHHHRHHNPHHHHVSWILGQLSQL